MNYGVQIRQTESVGNALRGVPRRRERVQQVRNGTEAVPYRTVASNYRIRTSKLIRERPPRRSAPKEHAYERSRNGTEAVPYRTAEVLAKMKTL
jgi:hypothetical protein